MGRAVFSWRPALRFFSFPKRCRVQICFTVHARPQPQGSTRAFTPKGWKRPIITTDNAKLKPYREQVARMAIAEAQQQGWPMAPRGTAIRIHFCFYLARPVSLPKKISAHTRKPDASKLLRATEDALTGILYEDDSQITAALVEKSYGLPERVEICVETI